jgi:hypothetical protein
MGVLKSGEAIVCRVWHAAHEGMRWGTREHRHVKRDTRRTKLVAVTRLGVWLGQGVGRIPGYQRIVS